MPLDHRTALDTDNAGSFEDSLAALVRRVWPWADRIERLRRLSGGASQETWSLAAAGGDQRWQIILRRAPAGPPHPGKIDLETEAALMRTAAAAGVPSPQVLHVLAPDDNLGRGFLMSHVYGETLGRRIVRDAAFELVRPKLAQQLGEILARIHAIDTAGLPELPRVSAAAGIADLYETYRRGSEPRPVFELAFRWLQGRIRPDPARQRLVHGDFRNGNMVVDSEGVRAVLDWELAHLGDPMRDLGWLCTNSWRYGEIDKPVGGFGARADLIAGYEAAGGDRVDPAALHFWEVLGSLRWGVLCIGMGTRARQSDRPVELSMIARRTSETEIDLLRLIAPRGASNEGAR
jgi:aminoglycoside phosphotransferase (APT) family kinase protein